MRVLLESQGPSGKSIMHHRFLVFNLIIMINCISWNIRVANVFSIRRIKKLIKLHKVSCLALLEPKITKGNIADLQKRKKKKNSIVRELFQMAQELYGSF